ncbi:MAG: hypothetical protein QOD75_737 [Blastocatellia bacterium]|nr:hypothetical protein [Blastocatellia bacterium]
MERTFTVLAFVFLIVAAVALWLGKPDAAFVLGTLGIVSWFLGFRSRLKQTQSALEATERGDDDSDEDYED